MGKVFVGNLPFSVTDDDLKGHFGKAVTVTSAVVIKDRDTGRSRGFGFVEVGDADVQEVIQKMDGKEMSGRPLKVNEARERERRGPDGGRNKRYDR